MANSTKVVHILDLCGHEKYLKTTMHGLSANYPDYGLIVIDANKGMNRMTKEHLGIVWALHLPFFVVFTKLDLALDENRKKNVSKIEKLARNPNGLNKTPVKITSIQDIEDLEVDDIASG